MAMKTRWIGIRGLDGDLDSNPTPHLRLTRVLDELLKQSAVDSRKAISKGRADPLFGYEGRDLNYLTAPHALPWHPAGGPCPSSVSNRHHCMEAVPW